MKTIMNGTGGMDFDAKQLGQWGEQTAKTYMETLGFSIVEMNYRTKLGEIDIIAKKHLTYHFIEIKARRGINYGLPREAISKKKQKHIKQTAMLFLYDLRQKKRKWKEISFDVIEVFLHDNFQVSVNYIPQCF
ncbi:YraN family protein [Veillonella agrestimuris]|uniref:YraN family protein n=1 Tax=Veillonella agrestimuris TaxID=2941340 RepID=UPI00203E76D7|nr:YraN family protein [Veillonella agrestimuris]